MRNRFRDEFIANVATGIKDRIIRVTPSGVVRSIFISFDRIMYKVNMRQDRGLNNSEKRFISHLNKFIKRGYIECGKYRQWWDEPICAQIDGTERIKTCTINYCSWLFYWVSRYFYEDCYDTFESTSASVDWEFLISGEICAGLCRATVEYFDWLYENGKLTME